MRRAGDLTSAHGRGDVRALVTVAEPVAIRLLRRAAAIDVPGHRSSHTGCRPRAAAAPRSRPGWSPPRCRHRRCDAIAFGATVAAFAAHRPGRRPDRRCPRGRGWRCSSPPACWPAWCWSARSPVPRRRWRHWPLLAAVWITGFVNAFNFMDGVNGISGAHALVGGACFACSAGGARTRSCSPAGAAVAAGGWPSCPGTRAGPGCSSATWAATRWARRWRCWPRTRSCTACRPRRRSARWRCTWPTPPGRCQRARAGERLLEAHRTHAYQRWRRGLVAPAGHGHHGGGQRVCSACSARSA